MYKGIYYVVKECCFPIQVIVSGKLSSENQKWLTLLSRNLNRKDAERIVIQAERLRQKDEKMYADSVLQVTLSENKEVFRTIRGESEDMCEALRELMKEDLDEALAKGTKLGKEEGRETLILGALKNNSSAEEIARVLGISLEEVKAVEKKNEKAD